MTTPDFQARHPKPWRFVVCSSTFSLRDANNVPFARMDLGNKHSGISQKEWNRHVAEALREYMTVSEDEMSVVNQSRVNHRYLPAVERAIEAVRQPSEPCDTN